MKSYERYETETSNQVTMKELQKTITSLPRIRLVNLPTPLEICPRFSETLSVPRILIKRDDLTGLAFGGNKSRKLEFILGEVKAKGADVVIHTGPSQSNEARQLAAAAAKVGIKPFLILWKDAKSKKVQGNLLLNYIFGADIRFSPSFHQDIAEELAEHLRKEGHVPYIIGQHDKVLGTVAFVKLALELYDQLNDRGINSGYIFLASDGATQAGLVLGFKILQADYKVIGLNQVKITDHKATTARIAQLANEAAKLLGLDTIVLPEEIQNYDDYVGKGYGMVAKDSLKAIELLAQTEGILLDPVYTGKAMAGLIDYIRKGKISADETVIFLHTGGTPALFAYNNELVHQLEYKPRVISRSRAYTIKAQQMIKEEGIRTLLHKSTSYFFHRVFQYRGRYIFRKNLNEPIKRFTPKVENYDFKIISTIKELYDSLERGFSINPPFSINDFIERLSQKQVASCIFIGGDLAHCTWVVMNENVKIYPPLKNINYDQEAYVWQVFTAAQYRGLDLYTYTLSKICVFLRGRKSRIVLTSLKDNTPAIRATTKLDFEVCGEMNYLKILSWEFWREKWYDSK